VRRAAGTEGLREHGDMPQEMSDVEVALAAAGAGAEVVRAAYGASSGLSCWRTWTSGQPSVRASCPRPSRLPGSPPAGGPGMWATAGSRTTCTSRPGSPCVVPPAARSPTSPVLRRARGVGWSWPPTTGPANSW